jgi:hypothetical protein
LSVIYEAWSKEGKNLLRVEYYLIVGYTSHMTGNKEGVYKVTDTGLTFRSIALLVRETDLTVNPVGEPGGYDVKILKRGEDGALASIPVIDHFDREGAARHAVAEMRGQGGERYVMIGGIPPGEIAARTPYFFEVSRGLIRKTVTLYEGDSLQSPPTGKPIARRGAWFKSKERAIDEAGKRLAIKGQGAQETLGFARRAQPPLRRLPQR